jgi:nicotinamidase-related amidase
MQPDLLKSLTPVDRQALVDSVQIALDAARQAGWKVVFTGLRFEVGYKNVLPQHRLYGALQRLHAKMGNDKVHWFLEGYDGSNIQSSLLVGEEDTVVVWRPSHLPSTKLVEVLQGIQNVTVVGIKASVCVQITCQYLCDRGLDVSVVRECVADDVPERLTAVVEHLIPLYGNVISLVDFIDHTVGLDQYEYHAHVESTCEKIVSYCCNVGRGGHSSLYMAHLLQRSEWRPYPKQKWFDDFVAKSYYCPLGKRVVEFCDEPKFSSISAFIKGREWLDEKEKLIDLAGKLMPETYLIQRGQWINQPRQEEEGPCWFVKEVNKNGGRAVQICHCLSDCMALTDPNSTYVVQRHIRHPLLTDDGRKCHMKFYSLLHCNEDGLWELYTFREAYLSTSPNQWSPTDISSDTQLTIF